MNFISLSFVFLFPVVLFLYWLLPARYRGIFLLGVSYFFYIKESSWAGLLLLCTTIVTFLAGRAIGRGRRKRVWLAATVSVCLGLLIGLKYSVPPVGISFYTFQTLSYVIDVYRGTIPAEERFGSYALFVSFFPQLVAGPIERAENLLGQLKQPAKYCRRDLVNGFWLILRGFYKKVVVADVLAVYVDRVYSAPQEAGGLGVILGTALFAIQIYCDFSGYTDIARGAARMMGIRLMENFRHPYRAVSIQDFWKRWHISLTRWFTDYVYIPLGGNREGLLIQCRNILLVFLLSGFWHGASWHFVVWGLLHGIFMVCSVLRQRLCPAERHPVHPAVSWAVTMVLVGGAWVFFRAPSVETAWIVLKQPFVNPLGDGVWATLSFLGIGGMAALRLFLTVVSWAVIERFPEEICEHIQTGRRFCAAAAVFVGMVTAIEFSWLAMMASGGENAFIYFRF